MQTHGPIRQPRELGLALRQSAIFGDLPDALLHDLEAAMELRLVPGGSVVLRQGEPSQSMLVVVSGRLRASLRLPGGERQPLSEIGRGDSAGEIGLILEQPRSADVVAVRDSTVAVLDRAGFERLLERHPLALNRAVARIMFDYARAGSGRRPSHNAQTIAIVPLGSAPAAREVADRLRAALADAGPTRLLGPADGAALLADSGDAATAASRLSELEYGSDFLLYQAEPEPTPWTRLAVRQADQVLFVATGADDPAARPLERALAELPGFAMVHKSLALLHPGDAVRPVAPEPWRAGRSLEHVYPLRRDNAGDGGRLARLLTGRAVGVVLGGGGARGFAHLGVLRALEESGIPVDAIGGNSVGALIAALYSLGLSPDEVVARTLRLVYGSARPALPLIALFSGTRFERELRRLFGEVTIEALWHPYFAVSCNLSRASLAVLDSGPLWRAVLASNTPPGLLPPAVDHGDLLVDGAVIDNVPVASMRRRLGTGSVIAVDVEPREELSVDPALVRLSEWDALTQRLRRGNARHRLPGIAEIITRAGLVGGLAQQQQARQLADHYLQPPVAGFSKLGYRQAAAIIEAGYRYAQEAIASWDTLPGRPRA